MYRLAAFLVFVAATAALLAAGCDQESTDAPESAAAREALPQGLILAQAPGGARGPSEIRSSAQEGQEVVVRGVVGGREEPMAANRAILTLLDESVKTCDQNAGDGCATPWDACCEPQEVIAANSATVQVVGADGQPLNVGLGSIETLAPLSRIIVTGTLHPSPDGKVLLINATGIHVEK